MRVGLDGRCIQDHFPGIGRYAFCLARELALIAPGDEWVIFHEEGARNTRFDLRILRSQTNVELVPVRSRIFSLDQQLVLPRLARAEGLDLYHSPYYVMPYRMPCPTVVTIHDLIPLVQPDALPSRWLAPVYSFLLRLAADRAEGILVDSNATKGDLVRLLRRARRPIEVAPLGVDERFQPPSPDLVMQYRQRISLHQPYLLYLGMNKPHKNLVKLVQAWSFLSKSGRRGSILVIAGEQDPRYPQVRQTVERLGLGQCVRFLGPVSDADLPTLYGAAECFVFPSLYEGFGLPVLEAMACGAPIACSDVSSLPEIVGDVAVTFDPRSVPDIARALSQLLSDGRLQASLGKQGRVRAEAFTWRRTAEATLALYRMVAKSSGVRPI